MLRLVIDLVGALYLNMLIQLIAKSI